MPKSALHGLRVVDLSTGAAGPYCTRILAGLGADVVKVEPPGGDPARRFPGSHDPERSPLFLFVNQGKQSVVLDVESARAELDDLLRHADVLVESYSPADAERLGLRQRDLRRPNPALVVTSITAFGTTGPYREYAAADIVAAALGGLVNLNGEPGREPLCPPGWQASFLAGASALLGTLLALYSRHRTGHGQQVDVSMLESVCSILQGAIPAAAAGGQRSRTGSRRSESHPVLTMPCRDGYVVVSLSGETDWTEFARFVGDERLADARARANSLTDILVERLRHFTRARFFRRAQEWRFPCCAVLRPAELARDPQHRARRFLVSIDHPKAGRLRYPGPPFRLEATSWRNRRSPLLGEHSKAEIAARWSRAAGPIPASAAGELGPAGALADIRVLDLTSLWAGPLCTRLLADAGAEVIKIELASRPDGTRRGGDSGQPAPLFAELNRNKLAVTLDLRQPEDRQRFLSLLRASDVVVENFSPRVMPNLELDYERLRAVKPEIVMLSMPAFGCHGPYRDAIAFGSGIEAMSGVSAITGYQDGPPELLGVPYGDPVAGLHGAAAVVAALEHRRRTGEGQRIELAQREALTQFIGDVIVGEGLGGNSTRLGNRHPCMAPHGIYPCLGADRWLAVAVANDDQWPPLCATIERPDLAGERSLRHAAGRKAQEQMLDEAISSWSRTHDPHTAMGALQRAGVPAGVVQTANDLLTDPQLKELSFLTSLPDVAAAIYPGPICHLSATPLRVTRRAPTLGQDNDRMFDPGLDSSPVGVLRSPPLRSGSE